MEGFIAPVGWRPDDGYILLEYHIETAHDPLEAATHLCRESSTATWARPGVKEDLRPRHGAKVVAADLLQERIEPSWDAPYRPPGPYRRARIQIAQPICNFGPRLPNLLTVACGEGAFHAPGTWSVKLTDMQFPDSYLGQFEGPRFGLEGLRERAGVASRPLLFGVVKPNVGLAPEPFAELAFEAWCGGLDIAKDDEMLADTDYSPLLTRTQTVLRRLHDAEQRSGERKLFLANITDEVERLREWHDRLVGLGGDRLALMLNGWTTGLSAVRMVARRTEVPLVAHFDFLATFTRMPHFGVSARVATILQRLAGFDAIIMPGLGTRMLSPREEVLECVQACLQPLGPLRQALPVPGGSDWAGTVARTLDALGTRDVGLISGRGIFDHPAGPRAGAMSMRLAWECYEKGQPLSQAASEHPTVAEALAAFG